MDIKRIVLYVCLAFIGVNLWQFWHKDYPATATAPQTTQNQAAPASLVPAAEPVGQTQGASHTRVPQSAQTIPDSRLVTVKTDLLHVTIDTKGGNIIRAELLDYKKELKKPEPIQLLTDNPEQLYMAQSGLSGEKGPDTPQGQAQFTANQAHFALEPGQDNLKVNLYWTSPEGVQITKTFVFTRDKYVVNVKYTINNAGTAPWRGHLYTQLVRRNVPLKTNGFLGIHPYRGAAISSEDKPYEKVSFKDMDKKNLSRAIDGGWLAMQEHYFLSAWIPPAKERNKYYSHVTGSNNDIYTIGMMGPQLSVAPNSTVSTQAQIFVGPELVDRLKKLAPGLDLTIDFGWLWFISSALFWLMAQIYRVVGNWGWAIVLVTVIIKALFYRLSAKSYQSMAKMRNLQPKINALKERYGDDKQALGQATIELYRKEKVNPLGGCLPVIVQIPVFIALYWVLLESVQLRHAPFILWIHDLSAPDPFYVLPIIMGASMLVQQKLNPPPPDPTQAKVMMMLPILFTFLFLYFPAGLVLYWVVNNGLSIAQQWYITQKYAK